MKGHYYCLMMVALSILTPIITSGLGTAAQYGVNALNGAIAASYGMITHYAFAHECFRVEKNVA